MATKIDDFIGTYTIRAGGGGEDPNRPTLVQVSQKLYIGTGTHGDPPPANDRIGASIFTSDGASPVFPEDPSKDPAWFTFQDGSLSFQGSWQDGSTGLIRPLHAAISLVVLPPKNQGDPPYRAPYGVILLADPDQVGSWGADDQSDRPETD